MDSNKNITKIIPLPGWVLIEPEKEDNKTASGVILPDSSQDVPMRGGVVASGGKTITYWRNDEEGKRQLTVDATNEAPVTEGQTVLFKKYCGQTIKHEGKELKLVEFKDLLAVIE